MSTESRLVHIVDEVPALDDAESLAMVLVLDGFLDAGNSAAIACRHLVDENAEPGGSVVATFDIDQLYDYRARRPPMSFVRDHYEAYDAPRLVVRLLHDAGGTPYLLLYGPEPDTRWEAFGRAVLEVVERSASPGSWAWARCRWRSRTPGRSRSPTTPTGPSCSPAEPVARRAADPQQCPSTARRAAEKWGHDALGFVAHIPHYLAQLEYPRASVALLEQVELAGSAHDRPDLSARAGRGPGAEIARYLAANEEVEEVVRSLEQQYDSFQRAEESGSSLLAGDEPLPTGEEIGQQFEQFLAGLEGPDEQQG